MDSIPGRPRRVGATFAFACLFLLGAMPVISNGRPAGTGALSFALWLSIWQLLFSLPALVREWRNGERGLFDPRFPQAGRDRTLAITLFTGTLFGLSTWAYVLAFEKVGATNAALALQAYPLCAAALEALFLGRRKSPRELAYIAMILAALYYLATDGSGLPAGLSAWFAVALAVPVLWSIAHVILREALIRTPITPNQVTTSRLVVSTAVLAALAGAIEGPAAAVGLMSSPTFQAFAVAMGLAYYLELILWFHAVRHVDVSIASTITVPAPAVTMALAYLFLNEPIELRQVAVLGIIAVALYGLLRSPGRGPTARQIGSRAIVRPPQT